MGDKYRTEWQPISLPGKSDQRIYIETELRGDREEVGVLDSIPFEQITAILADIASCAWRIQTSS